ncbi:MAG: NAD-dependent epimerase/dehydratase family protein [Planctomycetales bacterium]|nr:NAD-dependent epimerase/dehydratase family protein [Planctomycetales bacterium]
MEDTTTSTLVNWTEHHGDWFKGRRVLVTGGAGFIGSHLVEALVVLGARVVALDDLSGGSWENLKGFEDDVQAVTGSIMNRAVVEAAVDGCDVVFHQAALGSVPRSVAEPEIYWQVNVEGTLNVLQAAHQARVKRVLFAGSSSAYGDPPGEGLKVETMPPLPRSPYAATKLAGEHAFRAWYHSYGLDTCVLRYFNVFGPRQNANSAYAAVIAAFAKCMLSGNPGTIYGDGRQSRDFTFVANVVHGNLLAARHPEPLCGEVFNVATSGNVSVNELYSRMQGSLGKDLTSPIHQPARPGDVLRSQADINKANQTFCYSPIVHFDLGLKKTIEWYTEQLKPLLDCKSMTRSV